jgi:hypothetical protein
MAQHSTFPPPRQLLGDAPASVRGVPLRAPRQDRFKTSPETPVSMLRQLARTEAGSVAVDPAEVELDESDLEPASG